MESGRKLGFRSWTTPEPVSSGNRRTALEREVLKAISDTRHIVPSFARGEGITEADVWRVVAWVDMAVGVEPEQECAAILWPRMPDFSRGGRRVPFLILGGHVRATMKLHILLHEVHHVRRGDVEERTKMIHTAALPQCEPAADMYALMALLDREDFDHGPEWLEERAWAIAPIEDAGWKLFRRKDLAPRLIRMRKLVDEWLE